MKKLILLITFFLFIKSLSAQKAFDSNFNEIVDSGPIGKLLTHSISQMKFDFDYEKFILNEFNVSHSDTSDYYTTVWLKPFTKEPIFSIGKDVDEVKKLIDSYNIDEFINSWEFESLLDKSIDNLKNSKPVFTLVYFLLNMPIKPDTNSVTNLAGQKVVRLDYHKYNLSLFFKDEILISYHKN